MAHGFGEDFEVLGSRSPFAEGFEDGLQVANGDAFAEEVVQDALQLAGLDLRGDDFFDQGGGFFLELLEEGSDFFAGDQLGGVGLDDFGDVGSQDTGGFDDGVVHHFGLGALAFGDPPGGETEGGFLGFDALEAAAGGTGIHGEVLTGVDGSAGERIAAELDDVVVGFKLHVVADADGGDDDAEFDGDLAADEADAFEEVAALGGVDELDELVTDFKFHGVDVEERFDFVGFFECGSGGGFVAS